MAGTEAKECIICLGSTGLGKSSLIRLFADQDVHVSHGAHSDTKTPIFFSDKTVPNRLWLDTMGTEDSSGDEVDEESLRKILLTVQRSSANRIKIIWLVKREVRATDRLQVQAKFIASLGHESESIGNIWDSVIVIVKEGELNPRERRLDHCQGALAAAAMNGARILDAAAEDGTVLGDCKTIGYTCLDWIRSDVANDYAEMPARIRRRMGFLREEGIVNLVSESLAGILHVEMMFVMRRCTKCGQVGDPRCVSRFCHTSQEEYHPQQNVFEHTSDLRVFHPFGTQMVHDPNAISFYHPSAFPYQRYHPGELEGSGRDNRFRGSFLFDVAGAFAAKYTCCGGQLIFSEGCASRPEPDGVYPCCSRTHGSTGCMHQHSCSSNCSNQYRCCGHGSSHAGCTREYGCCHGREGSTGCRLACCGMIPGQRGCRERCRSCRQPWGVLVEVGERDGRAGCVVAPHEFVQCD